MRKHLLAQLENKTMTPFPEQTKRVKHGKEVTHRFTGAILQRWSEERQRIFHGVLFSLQRMIPQDI